METYDNYYSCFRNVYYSLYSNSNTSRAENIISDISKILLFKLLSEQLPSIYWDNCSGTQILKSLRAALPDRYNGKHDEFHLSDENIRTVIVELSKIELVKAPAHIIGDAFQSMIGPKIRGDKGQFFTPKELVACMTSILSPSSADVIMDPACGTGGFLIEAFQQVIQKTGNISNQFQMIGMDKDSDMADLAFAATKIIANKHAKIFQCNSLEIVKPDHELHYLLGTADYIFTNPPFGAKIAITDTAILSQYDFGHRWIFENKDCGQWLQYPDLLKSQSPQVLFLELCIKLLKDHGKLAIVLPEGMFGNQSSGYLWRYLREHGKILGMIDCPRNTFQPSTDTKTNVLFFEKGGEYSPEILIAVAKQCGHDKRGNTTDSLHRPWKNDFISITEDYFRTPHALWKAVMLEGTYYVPRYLAGKMAYAHQSNVITIADMMHSGYLLRKSGKEIGSEAYGTGNIPFVRTSDISNFEISTDPTNSVSEEIYNRYAAQQNLKIGDILFVADGRYRIGKTAIITKYNLKCLIQSHIEILSLTDQAPFTPFEFLYSLNSISVQEQVRNMIFVQSTLGTLGSRIQEIAIPLPLRNSEWDKKIRAFQTNIETRAKCLSQLKKEEHFFDL